jgi:hypothetical protein
MTSMMQAHLLLLLLLPTHTVHCIHTCNIQSAAQTGGQMIAHAPIGAALASLAAMVVLHATRGNAALGTCLRQTLNVPGLFVCSYTMLLIVVTYSSNV